MFRVSYIYIYCDDFCKAQHRHFHYKNNFPYTLYYFEISSISLNPSFCNQLLRNAFTQVRAKSGKPWLKYYSLRSRSLHGYGLKCCSTLLNSEESAQTNVVT